MENQIVIYQTDNGQTSIDVRLESETVWLTQAQMAELFQKDRTDIGRHIRNIFKEGELEKEEVCANFAHTTQHGAIKGKKQVQEVILYNLDVIISLDRIQEVQLSEETFKYPKKFNPENYFKGCFGIIRDEDCTIETVKLKVSADQANYLRSLPLHTSQEEVECNDDYSIFTLQVRPTFDFQQELLWNGDALEVLEPLWLRKEMASKVKQMWNHYKK